MGNAEEMAELLRKDAVVGQCLFWTAYIEKEDEEEAVEVNAGMLRNFLDALTLTDADRSLERVILTTGAKHYGIHLGPVKCPMVEIDPWIEGPGFPPNFYYDQQRILQEYSKTGSWDWVVTYPIELEFPGSQKFYTMFDSFTSAKLHAEFNLWAALEEKAGNQVFNVVNGDVESWANLWPKLASRFGCVVPERQFERRREEEKVMELSEISPLEAFHAREEGLVRSPMGGSGRVVQRVDLVEWSKKEEVKQAWEKIAGEKGLDREALGKATWAFLGFVLGREYELVISMSKARSFGWTGYVDTWSAFEDAFERLEKEGIVA